MKIGFHGIELPEGKVKYNDPRLQALERKIQPKKTTPFFVEFLRDEFVQADAIVISRATLLDLLILDMEKLENRRERASDENERVLLTTCLATLEQERPLCDTALQPAELTLARSLAPVSLTPTVVVDAAPEPDAAIDAALAKAGMTFFYTAGKQEVHAWPVPIDSDIVTCAGKIHTDFARGFIRADVVAYDDFMSVHGMQDARQRGLVKAVGRDYRIVPFDVIEVHFSV